MLIGSEGILGVITRGVGARAGPPVFKRRPASPSRLHRGRRGGARAVAERAVSRPTAGCSTRAEAALRSGWRARAARLLVLGFESADHPVDAWMERALECCADHGGDAAEAIGARRGRGASSDESRRRWRRRSCARRTCATCFVAAGVISETFETAITWDRFAEFHASVSRADERRGAGGLRRGTGYLPLHARLSGRPGALLHGARAGAPRVGARAVGRDQGGRIRGGDRGRRHDHAPPRGRPRPPALVRPPAPGPLRRRAAGAKAALDPPRS